MLRAITDLDGRGLDKLAVEPVLGGLVHPLLADERLPLEVLFTEDALDVTLGISQLQRNVAEAEMAIGQIPP
jgi:hypothetical protein